MNDFYQEQYEKANAKLTKEYEKQGVIIGLCKIGLGVSDPKIDIDPKDILRDILSLAEES